MTISREREKTHMKCYKCKREMPEDAKFCPMCGSAQEFTRELIDRAIGNDQAAITQLYNMTKDNVYYTIKTMISDEDIAQDLTQDTFFKAMKNLGQLNEPAAFREWIKKIARNMTIDILRKRKAQSSTAWRRFHSCCYFSEARTLMRQSFQTRIRYYNLCSPKMHPPAQRTAFRGSLRIAAI